MTDKDVINRLCKFAFISTAIGVMTIGICPAFAGIGVAIGIVLKKKNVTLEPLAQKQIKYTYILACVAFVFFIVDIILAILFVKNK